MKLKFHFIWCPKNNCHTPSLFALKWTEATLAVVEFPVLFFLKIQIPFTKSH